MDGFSPTSRDLFFSKGDTNDPRLGDWVLATLDNPSSSSKQYHLAGFPDDEGIGHNGGRPGARQGPDAIRGRLYRMTPPPWGQGGAQTVIKDLGNLDVSQNSLEQRHEKASALAHDSLKKGHRWIGLGGGHDYGFPDGEAFLKTFQGHPEKPLVINFDAHLDVRPLVDGITISSGTPFYRLLSQFPGQFDFVEVGLQPFCNSKAHFDWLIEMNGHALTMDQIRSSKLPLFDQILSLLNSPSATASSQRPCFLSVDIDVFSTSHAPGCSQSWPSGMTPQEFFPCFQELCNIFSVKSLGIYEVSPPLDRDDQTAKLAAEIIYRFIFG